MKLLVLLALSCVLRIGTGAILTEEMSMLNSQILENIEESDIKNLPNVLTKAPKNGDFADKVMKDIDHLLSSLQLDDYDGDDDTSYNASIGATCNWSENSIKCCQEFDLTGNTCLVAKLVGDDIKLFVQSGGNMMLLKTMSYKNTIKSMFQDVSELITGDTNLDEDTDVDSFDQEDILDDEQSEILTEEATNDNNSVDKSRPKAYCYWRRNIGACCKTIRVFRRKFRFCLRMRWYPNRAAFYATIGKYIIWRRNADICTRKFVACKRIRPFKMCIGIQRLYITKHHVKGCVYSTIGIGWLRRTYSLFCFSKWHG